MMPENSLGPCFSVEKIDVLIRLASAAPGPAVGEPTAGTVSMPMKDAILKSLSLSRITSLSSIYVDGK